MREDSCTMATILDRRFCTLAAASALAIWAVTSVSARADNIVFLQTNLVSDGSVPAFLTDPDLVNPWGIGQSPSSPFWVSDNKTGLATIYQVPGPSAIVGKLDLSVKIPSASGTGTSAPTGQVFNGGDGLTLSNGKPATFLFASEDGAISGWNPTLGVKGKVDAEIPVNHSGIDAVYKGLAIDDASGTLYAADFRNGDIEEYDSSFTQVNAPGS